MVENRQNIATKCRRHDLLKRSPRWGLLKMLYQSFFYQMYAPTELLIHRIQIFLPNARSYGAFDMTAFKYFYYQMHYQIHAPTELLKWPHSIISTKCTTKCTLLRSFWYQRIQLFLPNERSYGAFDTITFNYFYYQMNAPSELIKNVVSKIFYQMHAPTGLIKNVVSKIFYQMHAPTELQYRRYDLLVVHHGIAGMIFL